MNSGNGSLNGRRRVVVTGLGAVTPLGLDVESTWSSLLAGESGAGEITQFDHTDYPVHFACELEDFDPTLCVVDTSGSVGVDGEKLAAELAREHQSSYGDC